MSSDDLEKFVNREKELSLVREKVSRLAKGEPFAPHERVFHFVGPSGIGKSYLLEKIYAILTEVPACVPILIEMNQFRNNKELVGEFLAKVYQEFCRYQNFSINAVLERPTGTGSTLSKYSAMVVRAINLSTVGKVPVLLLDGYDILQREELLMVENHLLRWFINESNSAILITAGRRPSTMVSDFALRPTSKNMFLLPVFDKKSTSKQLEVLKPGSANMAKKFIELGSGVPGNTTKLVAHLVGNPPSIPDELQAIQSLLADVKGEIAEHFHPVIEATCVLQAFLPEDIVPLMKIHLALGNQWSEASVDEMFSKLKQVQVGPGGLINWDREKKSWTMDEPTRALFEKELKMRDPDLWRKLHCTAYQMYKAWGEEFNSDRYKNDAIYHQQCLQFAGMNCG